MESSHSWSWQRFCTSKDEQFGVPQSSAEEQFHAGMSLCFSCAQLRALQTCSALCCRIRVGILNATTFRELGTVAVVETPTRSRSEPWTVSSYCLGFNGSYVSPRHTQLQRVQPSMVYRLRAYLQGPVASYDSARGMKPRTTPVSSSAVTRESPHYPMQHLLHICSSTAKCDLAPSICSNSAQQHFTTVHCKWVVLQHLLHSVIRGTHLIHSVIHVSANTQRGSPSRCGSCRSLMHGHL
jgi:hypothetical protein